MKKSNPVDHERSGKKTSELARKIAEKGVPPVYLRDYVTKAYATKTPSTLLSDGKWLGRKNALWNVFSITGFSNSSFLIRLPRTDHPDLGKIFIIPRVEAANVDRPNDWFTIYDARFHPGSVFAYHKVNPKYVVDMLDPFACERCGNKRFRLSLGFEIPLECANPNDLSRFALAVECDSCSWLSVIYQDEIVKE